MRTWNTPYNVMNSDKPTRKLEICLEQGQKDILHSLKPLTFWIKYIKRRIKQRVSSDNTKG